MESFSKKLSKGFDQVKQYAAEKIGKAEEVTEMPLTFRQLDEKIDQVKSVYDGLYNITRQLLVADNFDMPLGDSVVDTFSKLNNRIKGIPPTSFGQRQVVTIQQATAEISLDGAAVLARDISMTTDPPTSQALSRYGQLQAKLGDARLEFNQRLTGRFLEPFNSYSAIYDHANRARKGAHRARLELDACKSKCRTAKAEHLLDLQEDLQQLERAYTTACDQAIHEMHNFVQYADATQCIQALIDVQAAYYQKAAEIFSSSLAAPQ